MQGGSTYVHCKAGRGRSTTIVLCFLVGQTDLSGSIFLLIQFMCKTNYMYEQIKYRNMTPEAALDHARSVRPRVLLAPSQWQVWSLTFIFLLPRL
jgi:atypical dual specificity phosphatase